MTTPADKLRALSESGTPGPWEVIWGSVAYVDTVADPSDPTGQTPMQEPVMVADAAGPNLRLIATARNLLPLFADLLATLADHRPATMAKDWCWACVATRYKDCPVARARDAITEALEER